MTALEDIAAERKRQFEVEGFDAAHDDRNKEFEMARAAACYARGDRWVDVPGRGMISLWPFEWPIYWWKPSLLLNYTDARRRDLVKAGALILAEIERLDRLAAKGGEAKP